MTAVDRIQWIAQQVCMGRAVYATFSYNPSTLREKVKFIIEDSFSFQGVFRPSLLGAISAVSQAAEYSIVTDKGHRSSSKCATTIEFWLKQPRSEDPLPKSKKPMAATHATLPTIDENAEATSDPHPHVIDSSASPPRKSPRLDNAGSDAGKTVEAKFSQLQAEMAKSKSDMENELALVLGAGVEGGPLAKLTNSSLDDAVAGNAAPPRKRVRFSLHADVSFVDADTLAPQSLE